MTNGNGHKLAAVFAIHPLGAMQVDPTTAGTVVELLAPGPSINWSSCNSTGRVLSLQ